MVAPHRVLGIAPRDLGFFSFEMEFTEFSQIWPPKFSPWLPINGITEMWFPLKRKWGGVLFSPKLRVYLGVPS